MNSMTVLKYGGIFQMMLAFFLVIFTRDLIIASGIIIISALFWFIPFAYYFKKEEVKKR